MTIELNSLNKDLQTGASSRVEPFSKFKSGYDKTSSLWNQGGLLNRIKAIVTALLETVRNVLVFVPNLGLSLANRAQLVFKPEPKPPALPTLPSLISAELPTDTQPATTELPKEALVQLEAPQQPNAEKPVDIGTQSAVSAASVPLEAPQQPTTQKTADQEHPTLDQPVITPVSTETVLPLTAPSDPGCLTKMATRIRDCVNHHPKACVAAAVLTVAAVAAGAYYFLGAPSSLLGSAASAVIGQGSQKAPEAVAYAGENFMETVKSLTATSLVSAAPEVSILPSLHSFSASALNATAPVPFNHIGTCDAPAITPFSNSSTPAANVTVSVSVDQINVETYAASSAPSLTLGSNSTNTTIYKATQGAPGISKVPADFFGSAASSVPPAPNLTPLYNSSMSATNTTVSVPFDHTDMYDAPVSPNDFYKISDDLGPVTSRSDSSPNVNNLNNPKQESVFGGLLKPLIGGGLLVAGAAYMLEKEAAKPSEPAELAEAEKAAKAEKDAKKDLEKAKVDKKNERRAIAKRQRARSEQKKAKAQLTVVGSSDSLFFKRAGSANTKKTNAGSKNTTKTNAQQKFNAKTRQREHHEKSK